YATVVQIAPKMTLALKEKCERDRVEALPAHALVIVAAPTDWQKTSGAIHRYGGVSVAYFEVNAGHMFATRAAHEIFEQTPADTVPLTLPIDGKQQQFRFIGDRAGE